MIDSLIIFDRLVSPEKMIKVKLKGFKSEKMKIVYNRQGMSVTSSPTAKPNYRWISWLPLFLIANIIPEQIRNRNGICRIVLTSVIINPTVLASNFYNWEAFNIYEPYFNSSNKMKNDTKSSIMPVIDRLAWTRKLSWIKGWIVSIRVIWRT